MAEAPQTLGRYRLQRKIGAGAMGLVYEALDPKLNRPVAIKTILKSHLDEEVSREYSVRFREEAQAVARLNHPNIVQVYDFGEEGDIAFIVMEFIRGRDLKHCFDNNQRFEAKEFVRLMCELLSALDYAHEAGIVHRDIKPANIMLDGQNRAKLMDFGVARITDTERTHRTQVGTMVGTPSYMSPEQVQGLWVDHRSDLFSSGIVLYQFLTGKRPFTGGDWTLRKAIVNDEPVRPSQINAALSPEFDRVVSRALAKAPEARYQSAGDFSAALQRVLEGKPAEDDGDQTVMRPAASAAPAVPGAPPAASPAEPSAPASGSPEVEVEFWRSIKDSEDPEDYELYLQQFPRGAYVRLAQRKMAKLRPGGQGTSTGTGSQNLGDSKLEVDTRVREAEARAKREAAEKLKRQAEDKARLEVERVRRESEERPRREADETAARRLAEEKSRREAAEEKARREAAEEMARREAESRASPVAPSPVAPAPVAPAPVAPAPAARAPVEPVRREPDERARLEAEIRAKREAEEKAWREGQERARRAAEERAKRQAEAKAQPASADAPEEKRVEAPEDLTVAVAAAVAKVAPKRGAPVVPLALAGGALLVVAAGAYFALRSPEEPVSSAQPPPQLVKVDPAPAPAAAPPAPAAQPAPQLIPPAVQPAPPPPEPAPAEPAPAATQPSPAKPPSVQEKAKRDAEEKAAREAEEHARRQRAEQEQREKAKLAAEEKKRQTAARLAEEEKKRAEAARLAAEEDRKRQAARQAAEEEKKRAEAARLAEEQKKRAEAARLAAEEEKKRAEAARLAAAEEEKKRAAAKAAEEQKRAKAPELFARAAELEGQGKVAEAVKLYTAAANANHGPSAKKLGDIYSGGKGDVAQDYTASLRWHAKARQLGETVQRGGTR